MFLHLLSRVQLVVVVMAVVVEVLTLTGAAATIATRYRLRIYLLFVQTNWLLEVESLVKSLETLSVRVHRVPALLRQLLLVRAQPRRQY